MLFQETGRLSAVTFHSDNIFKICKNLKGLQQIFNYNPLVDEENKKVVSKALFYIKFYYAALASMVLTFNLKQLLFPESGLEIWTWRLDVVGVSPYFYMILFLQLLGATLILCSCTAITTIMLGLVVEMKVTINIFREGIKSGMLECTLGNECNNNKKCLEFISKCAKCHVGIIE